MKVIKIESQDDDYWAMYFEKYGTANEETWKIAQETGEITVTTDDGEEITMDAEGWEFTDVDPDFIEFVRDMQDYDFTKQTNFFVVK